MAQSEQHTRLEQEQVFHRLQRAYPRDQAFMDALQRRNKRLEAAAIAELYAQQRRRSQR